MPRIEALERKDLAQYSDMFNELEAFFGFLPNDYLTMARKPGLLEAVAQLTNVCMEDNGKLPMPMRLLVTYSASRAAGCNYCIAHNAALSDRVGLSMDKIHNIHLYETHDVFSSEEKVLLRVAAHANSTPNAVTDDDFVELRKYFDDDAIVEIFSLVGMMSFYNRWNDSLATSLERPAIDFAQENITESGWKVGNHE
jgi:uncharacterized peroxidase-related enzyme